MLYGYLVRSFDFDFLGNSGLPIGLTKSQAFAEGSTATRSGMFLKKDSKNCSTLLFAQGLLNDESVANSWTFCQLLKRAW